MLRFKDFLLENHSATIEKYNLDTRFPWVNELSLKIESVEQKSRKIKEKFNWESHAPRQFEFNIKQRNFPDTKELSKKYKKSEDYIWEEWDLFLSDNLESFANSEVDEGDIFDGWGVYGRSGGWLTFNYDRYKFNETEDWIEDLLWGLNDFCKEIEDKELAEWNEMQKKALGGYGLLKRLGKMEQFKEIEEAQNLANEDLKALDDFIKEMGDLEKKLEEIEKTISEFWKKAPTNFEHFLEENISDYS